MNTVPVADGAPVAVDPPAVRPPVRRRGYAGRTCEQLSEERRQRLLEAALELFATRGYARTPIELLCSTARVTTRHFYEHFQAREAVLVALYDRITLDTRRAVMEALSRTQLSTRERMLAALRAFVDGCTLDVRRTRILCVEVIGVSQEMFERRRANVHEFADVLNAYTRVLIQEGELPDRDYRMVCIGMVGAIREIMTEWLTAANAMPVETVHDQLARMLTCVLVGARETEAGTRC